MRKSEPDNVLNFDVSNCKPDLEYLRELSGGDQEFVAEIIEMFMKDAPNIVKQSMELFQDKNFELLRTTVHKLKSSVQVLGNHQLVGLIQEIEDLARRQEEAHIRELINCLNEGVDNMSIHLKPELEKLSG